MASYTVAHLETVANQALEAMERAGELSGYKVEIDPAQDVASTSLVEFVIKNVAVPVMRHVRIKSGSQNPYKPESGTQVKHKT